MSSDARSAWPDPCAARDDCARRRGGAHAAAASAGEAPKRSFTEAFQQSGGKPFQFVGCDCGTVGCVIFDQGKEMVCPPV